jgi:hypothetical protein
VKKFQAIGYILDRRRAYRRHMLSNLVHLAASLPQNKKKTVAFIYVKDSCCLYGL